MKIPLFCLFIMSSVVSAAETASDVFDAFSPSVVLIETKYNKTGTGFFAAPGLILTNRHVARSYNSKARAFDEPRVIALKSGKLISEFNSIYCSYRVDVCAISVAPETSLKSFPKLLLAPPKAGREVFVIGHPQGIINPIISAGIVSSETFTIPNFDSKGKAATFRGFTTTAAISAGSSGSPVLSGTGELLGIAVSLLPQAQNINLIIGTEELSLFAKQIAKKDTTSIFVVKPQPTSTASILTLR